MQLVQGLVLDRMTSSIYRRDNSFIIIAASRPDDYHPNTYSKGTKGSYLECNDGFQYYELYISLRNIIHILLRITSEFHYVSEKYALLLTVDNQFRAFQQ